MFTVCSGIVIVKFYCINTRLEIRSTRLYTGNLFWRDCGEFLQFFETSLLL